nr:Dihydrofolate reductase [uncultured bacterium]
MKVSLVAAITLDGYISRTTDKIADWTSKEDKKVFVEITKRAGVIIMGGTTFRTIGRALPGRRNIVYTKGAIDVEGIETTSEEPRVLLERLEREGCTEVAICGGAAIYGMFLAADVVTDLYLTIEPVLFGSGISLSSVSLETIATLKDIRQLNESTVLMHYEVQN